MRIAVVAPGPFLAPRGSQVLIRQLAEALARRGCEVHVVCYSARERRVLQTENVRVHQAGRSLLWARHVLPWIVWKGLMDLAVCARLRTLLRRHRFDLIHAHNYEGPLIAWLARYPRRIPVVYHAHNLLRDELPAYFRAAWIRRTMGAFGAWLDREIPSRANAVIVLSRAQLEELRSCGIEHLPVLLCPPPRDVARESGTERLVSFRRRYLVAYAGNLDAYQDLDVLAQAIECTANGPRTLTLLLVTHEADWNRRLPQALAALIRDGRARVVWAAGGQEVMATLRHADVLVCPRSSWSGFPVKLVNYTVLGKPTVLAASVAAALDWPEPAAVFREGDAQSLARILVNACADSTFRQRLVAAACLFAARLPSVEEAGAELEAWFRTVLGGRGKGVQIAELACNGRGGTVLGVDTHLTSSYKPADADREGETRA